MLIGSDYIFLEGFDPLAADCDGSTPSPNGCWLEAWRSDSQQELGALCLPALGSSCGGSWLAGGSDGQSSTPVQRRRCFTPRRKHAGEESRGQGGRVVQIVCTSSLASLRQKTDRMENVTPYRIRHLCNISAMGPAKVQGFGGLLRARKASLDLPGKWVGAELWERSPALHAKQTHCLASWPGKRTVTGTFSGVSLVPLQPHRNPGNVSAVQTAKPSH